jgi:hypothetical protein
MKITAERFKAATGIEPEQDDLERCNCRQAGAIGHWHCGWDRARNLPVFWPKIPQERVGEIMREMRKRGMN